MRFNLPSVFAASTLLSSALASSQLVQRTGDTDTCGEVDDYFKVPNKLLPGKYITLGKIDACLCVSTLPYFVATNIFAISGSVLVGKAKVIEILTDMIQKCPGQTCHYPPHSAPQCQHNNPCGFTCKDGYTPYPSYKPTQCVCKLPYKECNGKCGVFHGCPSGYGKRELQYGTDQHCPKGLTACGVLGWNAKSWECLNTQTELESCGGCVVPLHGRREEGQDCTALAGVSDVSCVKGQCLVHRCRPGYQINATGDSCAYVEGKDPVVLAAQYGLEHQPL